MANDSSGAQRNSLYESRWFEDNDGGDGGDDEIDGVHGNRAFITVYELAAINDILGDLTYRLVGTIITRRVPVPYT